MVDNTSDPEDFSPLFENLVDKFDDISFVVEMLSIFVVDGATTTDRLMSAIMLSDASSIRNSLHSLKNILGTMQAGPLVLLAERTAEAFRNGNTARMNTDAADLISGTRRLVLAAEKYLGELQRAVTP